MDELLANFLMTMAAKAQGDATRTARQSGKRPTVTRTEHGDACKWCRSLAGTYQDPSGDVFKRHGGCEGKIVTSGYMSKNGLLGNYKKPANGGAGAAAPIDSKGGQVVYRGTGNNTSGFGNMFGNALYVARDQQTAAQFGTVNQLSMPLRTKDILYIASDAQLDKLQLDAQKWAVRTGFSLDPSEYLPGYLLSRGFKAAEVAPTVDPFAGIAIVDPKIAARMLK